MKNLIINSSSETPYFPRVSFDSNTGVCEISGESFMEETYKFYSPLFEWLEKYLSENKPVTLDIKLTYFNTSSSRSILDLLDILREYMDKGGKVAVNWYYDLEDPDMEDEVEDFKAESGLEINLKPFKEK